MSTPKLTNLNSSTRANHRTAALTHLPPIFSPQEAAANKRAFLKQHGGTATQEELDAELTKEARKLEHLGMSWKDIGKRLGCGPEKAKTLVHPEWRTRQTKKKYQQAQARKSRKGKQ